MNRYEQYLKQLSKVLKRDAVYIGSDMRRVEQLLLDAGFKWATFFSPSFLDTAIRVDSHGILRQSPLDFYQREFSHLEIIQL